MRRIKITVIGNTEIFLHPAVLPFAVYACLTGHGVLWGIASLSILAHEAAHAFIALIFKCLPSAVEITPLGAVLLLEEEMKLSPMRRAVMLLGGPTASLIIGWSAVMCTSNGWLKPETGMTIFVSNISIFLVNLIPSFPLDGGRLMHLILCQLLSVRTADRVLRTLGYIAGVGLLFLNLYSSLKYGGWNLTLAFAGCCILYSTSIMMTTNKYHEIRMYMDRKIAFERRGYMKCSIVCTLGNLPMRTVLHTLPRNKQTVYFVFEPGTLQLKGVIGEGRMIQQYLSRPESTISEALFLSQNPSEITKYNTI